MDFDLFSDYLVEDHTSSSGQLLKNLLNRPLTSDGGQDNDPAVETIGSKTLVPCRPINPYQAGAVITKIEDIFESIADCILNEKKELTIQLKSRANKIKNHNDMEMKNKRIKSEVRSITFPSKSPQEAWKFTVLLRILELSHEALVTGVVTTKRDIFYRDTALFIRQGVVDRYVDDIALTLSVERDDLNVVAAAKGLVAGSFSITRKDDSTVDYSIASEGILILNPREIGVIQLNEVQWILVIEKEAKGYPDIQTRLFLHLLFANFAHVPIYALVDYDPDGLGITSTYKHGSINLAHESNLAVPSIRWLGVRSCDFIQDGRDIRGLLKLSARDRRIATKMLGKEDVLGEEGMEIEWRRELQVMLMLNVKAEIQILGGEEKMREWLDGKLMLAGKEKR